MSCLKTGRLLLLALMLVGSCWVMPTVAKPGNGNGNAHGHNNDNHPHNPDEGNARDDNETGDSDRTHRPVTREVSYVFTAERRTVVVGAIYGTNEHRDLISPELRRNILSDLDSLPPGIRRQYLDGRSLPPGIAKQYELPATIQPLIDLDPEAQVLVIGRDILIVNRSTQVIWDIAAAAL